MQYRIVGNTMPAVEILFDQAGESMYTQSGGMVWQSDGIEMSTSTNGGIMKGVGRMFGGEGFILQDLSGVGMAFLEIDGDKVIKDLQPGEVLKVDTGNVVAFERSVSYEIETVKGLKNIFLGGEGLFLTRLVGPGRVILQTQNINEFAGRIARMIPSK